MPQTMNVPDHITRAQLRDLCTALGFGDGYEDLTEIVIGTNGIHATLIARDPQGKLYLSGGEFATHTIAIPLRD
jgi:hypothetical protein